MTPLPVRLTAAAERDLVEASQWYQTEAPAFDPIFRQEVRACLQRIGANPGQYPVVHRDVRRAIVHRFPYSVLYRRRMERVQVIAVVHQSRDPKIWKNRR